MPIVWPSSTGNAAPPKSSTMWRTSALASAAVSRKLPVTVAIAGFAIEYRLTYGCAADHGGNASPPWPSVATDVIRTTSDGSSGSAPASSACCVGRLSHDSCSASVYGCALSTCRQLSIAPVGQGEMQSLQKLHFAASTT